MSPAYYGIVGHNPVLATRSVIYQVGDAKQFLDTPAVEQDVRVLLVDDHKLVRQVLARVFQAESDIEVVGEGSNGQEALDLTRQLVPDVMLISVRLPVLNGVDATRAVLAEFPDIHVIGLTLVDNGPESEAIREAGATACVSKSGPLEELIRVIRDCHPKKGTQIPRRE